MAAADAARTADLLVTSRYHPAVFAAPAGVPTLGIAVDDYTTVKLTGALGNFGQDSVVSLDDVLSGAASDVLADAWRRRDDLRGRGLQLAAARKGDWDRWFDRIAEALSPAASRRPH
ncbi:hypothetical protein GCM10025866_28230 [Naasia aerilata]|uniref:Polysaccharide pyruvyl transferase domain-containing protein n=1 Tax=Naasia aerilata TaxID=1162966 RepID=A0ABM8GF30_9MICO|nr:hypothetical protein GCM10025866_28230 [Naasia aerilata]